MYLSILTVLLGTAYAKPLSSCASQIECLNIDATELPDLDSSANKQYEICLFWQSDLVECSKDSGDTISHARPSRDKASKIEGWLEGRDNAMCNIVSCDQSTIFSIKDGRKCTEGSLVGDLQLADYDKLVKCYDGDGSNCGGSKNTKACRWIIPAPDCDDEPATTSPPNEGTPIPTSVDECQCPVFEDGTAPGVKIPQCLSESGCALLSAEDECECHYCDCAVINTMVIEEIGDYESVSQQCNDCVLCEMNEGCEEIDMDIAFTYVRDPETGLNINGEFIAEDKKENNNTLSGINAVWLIASGSVIVFVFVIIGLCFFWRNRSKRAIAIMNDVEDGSDQEVQVDTETRTFTR